MDSGRLKDYVKTLRLASHLENDLFLTSSPIYKFLLERLDKYRQRMTTRDYLEAAEISPGDPDMILLYAHAIEVMDQMRRGAESTNDLSLEMKYLANLMTLDEIMRASLLHREIYDRGNSIGSDLRSRRLGSSGDGFERLFKGDGR